MVDAGRLGRRTGSGFYPTRTGELLPLGGGRAGLPTRPAGSEEPSAQPHVMEHQQAGGHVGGRHLTARDQVGDELERDPLAA